MSHYLVYWKAETVAADEHLTSLQHSASSQYGRLATHDVLWIVTSEAPDDLVLVGRQFVDHVVGQAEAQRRMLNTHLWEADYHVICDQPENKMNIDISSIANRLRFDGGVDELPEGFTGKNLQTMRRLDDRTAERLERIWENRHNDSVVAQR